MSPGDDLISEFAIATDADKKFTGVELLAIALALLVAGYETSSNLIGNGALALFEHPGQLEKLRRQPSLIGSAWKRWCATTARRVRWSGVSPPKTSGLVASATTR